MYKLSTCILVGDGPSLSFRNQYSCIFNSFFVTSQLIVLRHMLVTFASVTQKAYYNVKSTLIVRKGSF